MDSDTLVYVVNDTTLTLCEPVDPIEVHLADDEDLQELISSEIASYASYPVRAQSTIAKKLSPVLLDGGVVILPTILPGQAAVINQGTTIDTALLQTLLNGVIQEAELHPDLIARLDAIPSLLDVGINNQEGYAKHDDLITLDHTWSVRPPKIELLLAHGMLKRSEYNVAGFDHVEIAEQEIIYGHTGFINDSQFTVKAAILTKGVETLNTLNFTPATVTGVPALTVLTTESANQLTTNDCMQFRIKGNVTLQNAAAYDVAGSMAAQMRIDGGNWVNLFEIYRDFDAADNALVSRAFDVIICVDKVSHTYEFRGELNVDSGTESNRRLTGGLTVATVHESGTGDLLSNDLLIKWTAKE